MFFHFLNTWNSRKLSIAENHSAMFLGSCYHAIMHCPHQCRTKIHAKRKKKQDHVQNGCQLKFGGFFVVVIFGFLPPVCFSFRFPECSLDFAVFRKVFACLCFWLHFVVFYCFRFMQFYLVRLFCVVTCWFPAKSPKTNKLQQQQQQQQQHHQQQQQQQQ